MIKVIAKLTIKEGMEEACKDIVKDLVAETRKEEGCIEYKFFQDINKPNLLTFVEEWESKEALDAHMKTKHFRGAMPKIAKLQIGESDVSVNQLIF